MLFGLCMWLIMQRRSVNMFLTVSAIVSYILSASYLALDLRRVAVSSTANSATPWAVTYNANYDQPLGHVAWFIYVAEVGYFEL